MTSKILEQKQELHHGINIVGFCQEFGDKKVFNSFIIRSNKSLFFMNKDNGEILKSGKHAINASKKFIDNYIRLGYKI